jgi:lipopolysaccharide biosynthesis glycosyltransferase
MIHVMVAEMEKGDRGARWLMWVDADSAVVNPALPLDIFLPPADFDDVHMLASQDQSGFNAGMFFIKCHSWSVRLLANALTLPKYKPNVGVDFAEQSTLWMVMNETDNRKHVLWQPKTWFNAYQWHQGYEGDVGSMFVHFPGLDDDRWNHMGRWLNILEGPEAEKWSIDLKHTRYPSQIDEFWKAQRFGRQTLEAVHESIKDLLKAPDSVRVAVQRLEVIMGAKTDKVDMVMKGVKDVKDAVELYKDFEQEETEEEKRLREEQEAEIKKKVSAGGDEGSKKQQPGAPAIPK